MKTLIDAWKYLKESSKPGGSSLEDLEDDALANSSIATYLITLSTDELGNWLFENIGYDEGIYKNQLNFISKFGEDFQQLKLKEHEVGDFEPLKSGDSSFPYYKYRTKEYELIIRNIIFMKAEKSPFETHIVADVISTVNDMTAAARMSYKWEELTPQLKTKILVNISKFKK